MEWPVSTTDLLLVSDTSSWPWQKKERIRSHVNYDWWRAAAWRSTGCASSPLPPTSGANSSCPPPVEIGTGPKSSPPRPPATDDDRALVCVPEKAT
ncbi:hypothetical protein C4D60_Mb02t21460 [Musa balbisiana]|uniref:Uncharacterized protein n=1 Tax=Musa balbisiana TaxID=52838 RepID=A0A4S8ICC6_MUSBA|nr:hypothetical protein C4D60_Mb02t21460 [Musa balbisiana]